MRRQETEMSAGKALKELKILLEKNPKKYCRTVVVDRDLLVHCHQYLEEHIRRLKIKGQESADYV